MRHGKVNVVKKKVPPLKEEDPITLSKIKQPSKMNVQNSGVFEGW